MPPTLALNSGSSSLKLGLFDVENAHARTLYSGSVDGIGSAQGGFRIKDANGKKLVEDTHSLPTQAAAIALVAGALDQLAFPKPAAIGHRIVHGGPHLREHQRITPQVMEQLKAASVFAPLHVPLALKLIAAVEQHFPATPQFACFDTAFHRSIPDVAARFALPAELWESGIRRYGFHGLSCESIVRALQNDGGSVPARTIIAHLGNGASITAVENGKSVDTTMGLTPTGGIVMGTRTGDLDPGVLLYLLRSSDYADLAAKDASAKLERLLDKQSGLLALSGKTNDMREVEQTATAASTDKTRSTADAKNAQLAIDIFCRTAKKAVGSYMAVLGELDLLVFSGGIGEHDARARAGICAGLEPLGLALDPEANGNSRPSISAAQSKIAVRIVPSREEEQIALHAARLLQAG